MGVSVEQIHNGLYEATGLLVMSQMRVPTPPHRYSLRWNDHLKRIGSVSMGLEPIAFSLEGKLAIQLRHETYNQSLCFAFKLLAKSPMIRRSFFCSRSASPISGYIMNTRRVK